MAGLNVANAGLTYINYEKGFIETLNDEARSYNMTRKKSWTGKNIEGRIHLAWSTALGPTEDGGAFPDEDKQDYTPYRVGRRFFVAKIGLTNGVIATAKGTANAARDALDSEVKGMLTGAMVYHNFFFFGDGTGLVATLNDTDLAGSATDVQVSDSRGLWVGGSYDVYSSDALTFRGAVTVVSKKEALDTSGQSLVTFNTTVAGATGGDKLFWNNAQDGAGNGRVISGLANLIGTSTSGTLQDVTLGGANSQWSSMVLDNSGTNRELTPALLRTLLAGMAQKNGVASKRKIKLLGTAPMLSQFEEMYEGELRLTPGDKTQGFASSSFQSALGRVDIEGDSLARKNTLFAVDPSELVLYEQRPLGWIREGEGGIFEQSHTNTKQTAVMLGISQLAIEDRRKCGRINDVTDGATIAFG